MVQRLKIESAKRPKQAVILAGGRGTRLRPFTDTQPKAMIEVHGKPFLEHQIDQMRTQGFKEIVLLLGYLPDVIQGYFGNGGRFGVDIKYSITPVDYETSKRMKAAEPLLDSCFILLYCDNYWPMQIDRMWERFDISGMPAMITVYSNRDGYTTNSVRVDSNGMVIVFDKSGQAPDLQGVEISYALIKKSVLSLLDDENLPFELAIYPRLAHQGQLLAYVTHHRYYSVGSHRRLPLTQLFFAAQPTIILDRDGVLNKKVPAGEYVKSWAEFEWMPGAMEALCLLKHAGYRVIVVTNQAGIARGQMTESDLNAIHEQMTEEARLGGGQITAIYCCPHHWDAGCECRKPKPGMLFQAQRDHHLDLTQTLFIGDDERDAQAAYTAGCRFLKVSSTTSLLALVRELVHERILAV